MMAVTDSPPNYDAIVVGSGPNGLAAAITLAENGWRVIVLEAASEAGGGLRTGEVTSPGFRHDICSSVYPLVPLSPFFKQLVSSGSQVELIKPSIALAHLVANDNAVAVYEDLQQTVTGLGDDGGNYADLIRPFLSIAENLFEDILAPPWKMRNPFRLLRFGMVGLQSARRLANRNFDLDATRGMFAGMAAHSVLPLDNWMTAGVGLMFCIAAHTTGWPIARGGASSITNVLVERLELLGGKIELDVPVRSLYELPSSRVVLFDTSPAQVLHICGDALPEKYRSALKRFRHGPGICKVDWALDGPIPWTADLCRLAGTVHLGGTFESVANSERAAWDGEPSQQPFLLVTQPSLFDDSRAPIGKHVAWAYCHVPQHSDIDMSSIIESRIENTAPGFRDLILARRVITTTDVERYNANYVGGDITGGAMDLRQMLARPVLRFDPYSTPNAKIFICSASTPPGPGVHGMCGYNAARSVMRRL